MIASYQNSRRVAVLLPMEWRLQAATASYVAASAFDFLMTWFLLSHQTAGGAVFVESNPIACYFLVGWGVRGLLGFKVAMVGFVAAVCHLIALRREEIARRVLQAGAGIVLLVVAYSAMLLVQTP